MDKIRFLLSVRLYLTICCVLLYSTAGTAQPIDPRGIYFVSFNGSFSGTEWFEITPTPAGGNRFVLSNITGGSFPGAITPQGDISLDGLGEGSFSGQDNFMFTASVSGTPFAFEGNRVPMTTTDFPLRLDSPRPANELLAGAWENVFEIIDAENGETISQTAEALIITTDNNNLRMTDSDGNFFQGVFENGVQVGFRRIFPDPGGLFADFASFPGSEYNLTDENILGEVRFLNVNSYIANFLLQTRRPLGLQEQRIIRYTGTRMNPLQFGDVNGDQQVNQVDRGLIQMQLGLNVDDDGFNLAADLDGNGTITSSDLTSFDNLNGAAFDFTLAEGAWLNVDTTGEGILFDFGPSLNLLFMAWFTFTLEPMESIEPAQIEVGFAGQRWMTGLLTLDGNTASGPLRARQGGAFDMPPTTSEMSTEVGEVTVEFLACDLARVDYNIGIAAISDSFEIQPLEKVVNPNGFGCG